MDEAPLFLFKQLEGSGVSEIGFIGQVSFDSYSFDSYQSENWSYRSNRSY
jgi:hypothetical protein